MGNFERIFSLLLERNAEIFTFSCPPRSSAKKHLELSLTRPKAARKIALSLEFAQNIPIFLMFARPVLRLPSYPSSFLSFSFSPSVFSSSPSLCTRYPSIFPILARPSPPNWGEGGCRRFWFSRQVAPAKSQFFERFTPEKVRNTSKIGQFLVGLARGPRIFPGL